MKKLLTMSDLYNYYSTHKRSSHFSSNESNEEIVVQVDGLLNFKQNETNHAEGLTSVTLQSCHTLDNVNGSFIDDTVMTAALPSFSNRPILGYVWYDSEGQPQFESHNMHIEEIGGEEKLIHDEIPVGIVPESCNAHLEYDEEKEKTYCVINGLIFDEYSPAIEILQRDGECSCSVELSIRDLSYDAKIKKLVINDFYFSGVTILGKHQEDGKSGKECEDVKPGMTGSNIKLKDFSKSNNSLFSEVDKDTKLIETLEKLNDTLSSFNNKNNNNGKEDSNVGDTEIKEVEEVTEVLEEETVETEVTEEATEEEVTDVTEEESEETVEDTPEVEEETEDVVITETEACGDKKKKKKCSLSVDGTAKDFELSLSDIEDALYNLVNDTYEADGVWYGIEVFDTHVIMKDWWNNKNYKQSYERTDDTFALNGDRVEVFANWLTADEEASLAELRANYSSISEKLAKYEVAEAEAQKSELLASNDYSSIADKAEFAEVSKDVSTYSVDELKSKLDEILLSYAKAGNLNFASTEETKKTVKVTRLPLNDGKAAKRSRYGNLFSKN